MDEPSPNANEQENRHFVRLNKVQVLLKELHTELDNARKESSLNSIIEDDKVKGLLTSFATILPSYTTNSHNSPVMANIQALIGQTNEKITTPAAQPTHTAPNEFLESSMHAPTAFAATAARPPPQPTTQPSTYHIQPQDTKIPPNPSSAYHPSRLVVRFLPRGIPENLWPDPSSVVNDLNAALSANQASKHMKIVAANFNPNGNLIISTRLDQSASDLLKFRSTILPIISRMNNDLGVLLREDKEWFKIQVDAVCTTSVTASNDRIVNTSDVVHSEFLACNPQYASLKDTLVSKPRWLRPPEKLDSTSRSSVVFATTDEAAAFNILKLRTLAAFGSHCSVKAFQDRTMRKNWNLLTRSVRYLK